MFDRMLGMELRKNDSITTWAPGKAGDFQELYYLF